MSKTMKTEIRLVDDGAQFIATNQDGKEIQLDFPPPTGKADGLNSLELVLAAVASCGGATLLSLQRHKRGRQISAFSACATGQMAGDKNEGFSSIHVEFTITSPDADEQELARDMQLAETKLCPVWHMLSAGVALSSGIVLQRP